MLPYITAGRFSPPSTPLGCALLIAAVIVLAVSSGPVLSKLTGNEKVRKWLKVVLFVTGAALLLASAWVDVNAE